MKEDLYIISDDFFIDEETDRSISIRNVLSESLYFDGIDKLVKQMKTQIPNFLDYILLSKKNLIYLNGKEIFVENDLTYDEFERMVNRYCYRVYGSEIDSFGRKIIKLCPEYDLVKTNKSFFIHFSPISNLDQEGIKARSSGKFEEYSRRIYLFPLEKIVKEEITDIKTLAEKIQEFGKKIVKNFNTKYNEEKDYYIYLVELPKKTNVFKDPKSLKELSVYIFSDVGKDRIKKICKITYEKE